jgi:hypothetical protein
MKRKFKPWWSTISPISTNQTVTSHLKSLNMKKNLDIWCWKSRSLNMYTCLKHWSSCIFFFFYLIFFVITIRLLWLLVNFSNFDLLQNCMANWNQNWWKCTLSSHLQSFMLFVPIWNPRWLSLQKQETSKVPKMCFFCFLFVRHLFFNHFWAFILFLIRFSLCRRLSSNFMNDVIFWCIPLSLFKDYWTLYSSILYIWHSCCLF